MLFDYLFEQYSTCLSQTFRDIIDCSVHLNKTLSDVHKCTYLCSLGNDARIREQLGHAEEQSGQPDYKAEALRNAIIQPGPPMNTPDILHSFYDQVETKFRGLKALGNKSR
ncbi:hypothetical protein DPMN_091511 [Dreissena polymorpha]|uniref:Uncharacterized protein n=1 Tax=Dreissena polymorpha TaxID=45954 RepID=A0A9D4L1Q7_DREPO|nr:hypothetical protein DPMN_091511 [Dreissena polymorpha]